MHRSRRTRFVALVSVIAGVAAMCALMISTAQPTAALTPTGNTVVAGNNFTVVLGTTGIARAFGVNTFGQLGNSVNNTTLNPNPAPSAIGPSNLIAVAAGHTWTVGLDSFGRVWTFGNNQYGQLGRAANVGTGTPNPVSTLVDGISKVTAISAGQDHTLALRADGTVWGWGTNAIGELGNAIPVGTLTTTPVQIPGLAHVIAIAAGTGHSLVLEADGTVWGFGYNYFGQLGNSTNNNVFVAAGNPTPTKVEGLPPASAIAAGNNFSLVLAAEGTVWGFGDNQLGQLGSTTNSGVSTANPTPLRADGLTSIIAISAGDHYSLALKTVPGLGGVVYAAGANTWGQLGKAANSIANPTPALVAGLSGVTAMTAGSDHTVVVVSGGSAIGFGRNAYGELASTANSTANPTPAFLTAVTGVAEPPSFVPLVPARLLDTRPGSTTIDGDYAGDNTRTPGLLTLLRVAGRGGVPNDASAVVLNVTVTQAEGTGFITVYPCGSPEPNASSLNYTAGATIANAVIAKVGTNGFVCLSTSASVQLIADVNGYYRDSNAFASVNPARLLDTRPDSPTVDGLYEDLGPLEANTVTQLSVAGRGGVPLNATAVALNVTVNQAQAPGYITAFPCGSPQPNASNVNFVAGSTIPNAVVVKIGIAGNVCFYASATTQLIVDVNAYFRDSTSFASLAPARLLDSRPGAATIDAVSAGIGLRPANSVTELQVTGRGGVPGATAAILNITVTQPQGNAFVTVFPCGSERPNASNINYFAGDTIAGLVIAKVGDDGKVCIYSLAATHLIVDVNAYYS